MVSSLEQGLQKQGKRIWAILFLGFLFIGSFRLGDMLLWQDEAESALVGRSVLQGGVPRAWDGVNLVSQQKGQDYREGYVWIWHSWLQYYLIAASFGILGEGEVPARLPFLFVGALCLPLLYEYGRRVTGGRVTSLLACLLLSLSVPFLLHARQCRWYTLPIFFILLTLSAYDRMSREDRLSRPFLFVALTLLFHSFYPVSLCVFAALFLHSVALRRWSRQVGKDLVWLVAWLFSVLPWCVFTKIFSRGESFESVWQALTFTKWYLLAVNEGLFPLCLIALLVWLKVKPSRSLLWTLAASVLLLAGMMSLSHYPGHFSDFLPLFVLIASVLVYTVCLYAKKIRDRSDRPEHFLLHGLIALSILLPLVWLPRSNYRYLLPLYPLACLLLAEILVELWKKNRPASLVVAFLLINTNALSWAPLKVGKLLSPAFFKSKSHSLEDRLSYPQYEMGLNMGLHFPLYNYFRELVHDYEGPTESIVSFFKANGRPGDTILTNYGDLPLIFYTDLRVLGGLSGHGWEEEDVDWIVIRRHWFNVDYLLKRAKRKGFEPLWLPAKDLPWSNRPLPSYHLFQSPEAPSGRDEAILILGSPERIRSLASSRVRPSW